MKKITKIFIIFMLTAMFATVSVVFASAEGEPVADNANESVSEGENALEGKTPVDSEIPASSAVTIWDRVSEYLTGDKLSQTVTFAYNIFCTILLIMMKRSTTTSASDLLKIVNSNNKTSKEKINELALVYNANEKEVTALKEEIIKLREEHKVKTVTAEQFTAALEGIREIGNVLETIYQNSSTVPTIIKTKVIQRVSALNEAINKAENNSREDV